MQWLENIKTRTGFFMLQQQLDQVKKKPGLVTLNAAENIAILYDATFIEKEPPIHKYVTELKSQGKKIYTIGFVDMHQLPGNKKYSLQNDFCWHEKMNFFKLPQKAAYETFLKTDFDLLLNLYEKPILPLLALSAWSNAKFKVGPNFQDGLNYFDAMIDTGNEAGLTQLISQIDFYFKIIT